MVQQLVKHLIKFVKHLIKDEELPGSPSGLRVVTVRLVGVSSLVANRIPPMECPPDI